MTLLVKVPALTKIYLSANVKSSRRIGALRKFLGGHLKIVFLSLEIHQFFRELSRYLKPSLRILLGYQRSVASTSNRFKGFLFALLKQV